MDKLSKRLLGWAGQWGKSSGIGCDLADDLREAARLVAAFEAPQPDVSELLERARLFDREGLAWLATDRRAYAASLARAKQAEAKVEAVKLLVAGLRDGDFVHEHYADLIEAALSAGEVRDGE